MLLYRRVYASNALTEPFVAVSMVIGKAIVEVGFTLSVTRMFSMVVMAAGIGI
jgi:hypothetical protein